MSETRARGVSSDAMREATGRGRGEWLETLDAAGAEGWSHKEIVGYLEREHPHVSSWWRQSITVEYERARGKREVGQTADAGFQVGVRRTVGLPVAEAWELVTTRPELWLGDRASVTFEPGERYEAGGATGEIRVVKPAERVRMTWQPAGWEAPATLQVTFAQSASRKTAIGIHLEKLPDAQAREEMRERFREALERIAAARPE